MDLHFDFVRLGVAPILNQCIQKLWGNTLGLSFSDDELAGWLTRPPETDLGDFSLPCFRLSKPLKTPPQKIAETLATEILEICGSGSVIKECKTVGGFLNIYVKTRFLGSKIIPASTNFTPDPKGQNSGSNGQSGNRVMIEYSQPNTHKEFHVGHGRNVCLGDSLSKIYRYNGHEVVPVNYIGDEGTHIAKCLWAVLRSSEPMPDEGKAEWLGAKYVEANTALKNADDTKKQEINAEISDILRKLESKQGEVFDLWLKTRQYCLEDFKRIYSWLNSEFEHYFFESDMTEPAMAIVNEYLEKGFFKVDQGAVGIDLTDYKLGFMMVRKSDGNTLYSTKDLALAKIKFNDFKIEKSIVVVASEQQHHFKQVFKTLDLMGFEQAKDCFHLSYGMVVRPDGKMSSRLGNSFTFKQLITMVTGELMPYLKKYETQWEPERIVETVKKLAVGSIKYGMVVSDPAKEIVFDPKEWTSFEGQTGPYLMYSYARANSILSKVENIEKIDATTLESFDEYHTLEHRLLSQLSQFNAVVRNAGDSNKPSVIAQYLFHLCKGFNRFYKEVPVLSAKDDLKKMRLGLIESFCNVLKQGLFLLGIDPPDRM